MTNTSDNFPFRGLGGKIFLIGFMGSGKTHWGRIWAERSSMEFFDLDEIIEAGQQKTIAAIFDEEGEEYFRGVESRALHSLAEKDGCIIACGGGAPCFKDNMKWMNEHGITVYLSATPQYIYERVLEEKDKRPLLKKLDRSELLSFIENKLKERGSFYKQAKLVLPAEELNDGSLSSLITQYLNA